MNPVRISIYSDYIWPFCYIGKGIVERLKREFTIIDDWLPFEIHPDTPPKGVLWKDYFPGMNPEAFFRQLDERGKKMGVRFGPQPLMSNSREALEGGEYAKENESYDLYQEAIFQAFFTDCRDIGDRKVILDVDRSVGLNDNDLNAALESGKYRRCLEETTNRAKSNLINSAPTFVIDGSDTITGAQPIDTFRAVLRDLQKIKAQSLDHIMHWI